MLKTYVKKNVSIYFDNENTVHASLVESIKGGVKYITNEESQDTELITIDDFCLKNNIKLINTTKFINSLKYRIINQSLINYIVIIVNYITSYI